MFKLFVVITHNGAISTGIIPFDDRKQADYAWQCLDTYRHLAINAIKLYPTLNETRS